MQVNMISNKSRTTISTFQTCHKLHESCNGLDNLLVSLKEFLIKQYYSIQPSTSWIYFLVDKQ